MIEEAWYELTCCFEEMCMFWMQMGPKYKVENAVFVFGMRNNWLVLKEKMWKLNQEYSSSCGVKK